MVRLYSKYKDFISYICNHGYKYLSYGGFREVYTNNKVVIKVPRNKNGLMDNRVEAKAFSVYHKKPTKEGVRVAPSRLLSNGCLMQAFVKFDWPTGAPAW